MPEPIPPMKRPAWKAWLPLALTLALLPALGLMQGRIDEQLETNEVNELLYFPNDKLLRHFTAGLDSVVADFLWFRTVQYTGETFASRDQKFTWLEHMINVTTNLSPGYEDPYRYGGALLAALDTEGTGRAENAMTVLKRGMRNVPHSWTIPYELHTIYLMNRRDEPKANLLASRYAVMVAERHEEGYRESFYNLSQRLLVAENSHEEAVELFKERLENATDPVLRALAEKQLRVVVIEKNLDALNQAVQSYRDVNGTMPERLEQLVEAKFLNALPSAPDQGTYYLDPRFDRVYNSVLETDRAHQLARRLTGAVRRYRDQHGEYPPDFDAIFEFMKKKPYNYPLPQGYWEYDPETGTVVAPTGQ